MSVIPNATCLIRECLCPTPLNEIGGSDLENTELLSKTILGAHQMVRAIGMLRIKGEGYPKLARVHDGSVPPGAVSRHRVARWLMGSYGPFRR